MTSNAGASHRGPSRTAMVIRHISSCRRPTSLLWSGHRGLRRASPAAADRGSLPASLLFHGPPGVGKQRLALWLAQRLLCTGPAPGGQSRARRAMWRLPACRFSTPLLHPDLHWVFPRPRSKDPDMAPADVAREYAEAIAERVGGHLLYGPADGADAIYVATVRALVHDRRAHPGDGARKVIVIGNAERMVPQEGADAAANAFLKLLEEPPADVTIILTSSAPGALLPTIRSRVVAVRVCRALRSKTWQPGCATKRCAPPWTLSGSSGERRGAGPARCAAPRARCWAKPRPAPPRPRRERSLTRPPGANRALQYASCPAPGVGRRTRRVRRRPECADHRAP